MCKYFVIKYCFRKKIAFRTDDTLAKKVTLLRNRHHLICVIDPNDTYYSKKINKLQLLFFFLVFLKKMNNNCIRKNHAKTWILTKKAVSLCI